MQRCKTKPFGNNWQSITKSGKTRWYIFLFTNEKISINTNINNSVSNKVLGYNADAKCIYENIPNPTNVFKRNVTPLTPDDIKRITGKEISTVQILTQKNKHDNFIKKNNDFDEDINKIKIDTDTIQ